MASFQVHEDITSFIENVRPKHLPKPSKGFPLQANKNRVVLQTLCSYQQNTKRLKPVVEKEHIPKKVIEDRTVTQLPNHCSDLIKLKPVFKKTNLAYRDNSVEKEYEEEIWEYLHVLEKVSRIKPNYMNKQMHLNWDMRSVLVDWLVSVAEEYSLNENVIHLSVNYLDRFLSSISVIREKFQLVGATAMMLASKLEEIYPPESKEWAYLTGDTFTVRQILKMEQLMLKVLNFEMNTPTMLDFIKHLCSKQKIDNKTMYLAMYFSELVLLEGDEYFQHFPSKLAAASVVLARHTLFKAEPWNRKLEETAGYSLKQLSPVVQKQQKTFKSSPFKEQQAIQKKYSSDKYQRVALLKPRVLVLDEEE